LKLYSEKLFSLKNLETQNLKFINGFFKFKARDWVI